MVHGDISNSTIQVNKSMSLERPREPHIFIDDSKKARDGTECVLIEFKIEGKYNCRFIEDKKETKRYGATKYRIEIQYGGQIDYIILTHLITPRMWMAYYIKQNLVISTKMEDEREMIDYIRLNQIKDKKKFESEMDALQRAYFGASIALVKERLGQNVSMDNIDPTVFAKPTHIAGDTLEAFQVFQHDKEFTVKI